ncbi:hypothetical protein [Mesoterricola silvestris]|uniref:Uncharacterized protein n=1 Tax=Mesoterricola silvestris TaxID=2927979 RepID=A0AA48KBQ9_9BACT|nr:hypothetical protein [Mesoterricola silvestris]BDU74572.1 hypothetical protein METEAL_37460 [Mesoterricola silvestris]
MLTLRSGVPGPWTFILLLTLAAATPGQGQVVRAMAADDPNLDPRWDWRPEQAVELAFSVHGEAPTPIKANVPFHTPGNRLYTKAEPDMNPEDGWILVHRDFGTPQQALPFPLFTLYNRFRGIFRVMLYNALDRSDSLYIGELSFVDGGASAANAIACFTFQDPERCFLDSYAPADVQRSTCVMFKAGDWAVFDYHMLGYDPALANRDPVLLFKLIGIEKTSIDLQGGGGLSLLQTLNNQDLSISGSSAHPTGRLTVGLENGLRQYRSVTNWYEELASEKHKGKPWQPPVQAFIKSGVGSFFPYAMAVAGFVEAWFGGANTASPWEPLAFKGEYDLKLKGGLERALPLWAHAFYMNPGKPSNRAQRPVQAVPWGIFNFPTAPTVKVTPGGSSGRFLVTLAKDPGILVNPEAGLDVTSIKVAFTGGDPKALVPSSTPTTSDAIVEASKQELILRTEYMDIPTALKTPCPTVSAFDLVPFMRWEIRFKTKTATRLMDAEQVMIKNFRWINPEMPKVDQPELAPDVLEKLKPAGTPPNCGVM